MNESEGCSEFMNGKCKEEKNTVELRRKCGACKRAAVTARKSRKALKGGDSERKKGALFRRLIPREWGF